MAINYQRYFEILLNTTVVNASKYNTTKKNISISILKYRKLLISYLYNTNNDVFSEGDNQLVELQRGF